MNSLQLQVIKILPRCTAALSFFGSSYITYDVVRKYRRKRTTWTVHDRLLFSMSVCDIITSTMFLLGDIPFPVADGGKGNQVTCNVQGFLVQLVPATVMYNGSLAVYYLLFIRYGWKEGELFYRMEIPTHIFIWIFVIATGIACIYLKLFNPALFDCWIIESPMMCTVDPTVECIRGYNAPLYQWVFYYMPVYFVIVLSSICMFLVYRKVKEQEKKSNKWNIQNAGNSTNTTASAAIRSSNNRKAFKHSRRVAVQGMFYIGAFYLTWILPTLTRLLELATVQIRYPMLASAMFLLPLQGFFNCLVYIRPGVQKYFRNKRKNKQGRSSSSRAPNSNSMYSTTHRSSRNTNNTKATTFISKFSMTGYRGSTVENLNTNNHHDTFEEEHSANENHDEEEAAATTVRATNGIMMSDSEYYNGHPPSAPNLSIQHIIPEENSTLLKEEEKLGDEVVNDNSHNQIQMLQDASMSSSHSSSFLKHSNNASKDTTNDDFMLQKKQKEISAKDNSTIITADQEHEIGYGDNNNNGMHVISSTNNHVSNNLYDGDDIVDGYDDNSNHCDYFESEYQPPREDQPVNYNDATNMALPINGPDDEINDDNSISFCSDYYYFV